MSITVFVDDTSATRLNVGDVQLRHTIILHSLRGKDNFISVSGNYCTIISHFSSGLTQQTGTLLMISDFALVPTCFANELETLVRLPGSIRQLSNQAVSLLSEMKPKTNAPREVIRLINWLMSNAAEEVRDLVLDHRISEEFLISE